MVIQANRKEDYSYKQKARDTFTLCNWLLTTKTCKEFGWFS